MCFSAKRKCGNSARAPLYIMYKFKHRIMYIYVRLVPCYLCGITLNACSALLPSFLRAFVVSISSFLDASSSSSLIYNFYFDFTIHFFSFSSRRAHLYTRDMNRRTRRQQCTSSWFKCHQNVNSFLELQETKTMAKTKRESRICSYISFRMICGSCQSHYFSCTQNGKWLSLNKEIENSYTRHNIFRDIRNVIHWKLLLHCKNYHAFIRLSFCAEKRVWYAGEKKSKLIKMEIPIRIVFSRDNDYEARKERQMTQDL